MQTYQTKRKAPDRAVPPVQEAAPSKSEMLHLSGAGAPQPMSPALREKFEPGFSADFSNIRISRGHIPEELGVRAVAQGTDILLDQSAGMDVLGHELAHVVQQAQGRVEGGFPVVENAALEHEADVMGARAASGLSAQMGSENGFGGEAMSIAPMSAASAPAQCKIGKNKPKKDKAAPSQQASAPAPQAAPPTPAQLQAHANAVAGSRGMAAVTHMGDAAQLGPRNLVEQFYDHDAAGNRLPGPSKLAQAMTAQKRAWADPAAPISDEIAKYNDALGFRGDKKTQAYIIQRSGTAYDRMSSDVEDYFHRLEGNGLMWGKIRDEARSSGTDIPKMSHGGNFSFSPDISQLSEGLLDIFSAYADDSMVQEQLREQYALMNGAEGYGTKGVGTQMDIFMQTIMNKQFTGSLEKRKQAATSGDEKMGMAKLGSYLATGLPKMAKFVEHGDMDLSEVPAESRPLLQQYITFKNKIGGIVGAAPPAQLPAAAIPLQTAQHTPPPLPARPRVMPHPNLQNFRRPGSPPPPPAPVARRPVVPNAKLVWDQLNRRGG